VAGVESVPPRSYGGIEARIAGACVKNAGVASACGEVSPLSSAPASRSHIFSVWSAHPETAHRPFGATATERTAPVGIAPIAAINERQKVDPAHAAPESPLPDCSPTLVRQRSMS
jgi:hypothetical protein